MRCPSIKRLMETFPDLTRERAGLVRKLAAQSDDGEALRETIQIHCSQTAAYAASCHHDPFDSPMWRRTMVLSAINETVGTFGVEPLWRNGQQEMSGPPFEYLNTGDTYAMTLVYRKSTDNLYLGSMGGVVEAYRL